MSGTSETLDTWGLVRSWEPLEKGETQGITLVPPRLFPAASLNVGQARGKGASIVLHLERLAIERVRKRSHLSRP